MSVRPKEMICERFAEINLQCPALVTRELNQLRSLTHPFLASSLQIKYYLEIEYYFSFLVCLQDRTVATAGTGTGSREDRERTSRWSSWPSWRGCSTRRITPTRSWGKNWARDSAWARRGFKSGFRIGVQSAASTRVNCTKVKTHLEP